MRVGKTEQAGAISLRIGAEIISYNSGRLHAESKEAGSKDLWGAVREITGKKRSSLPCNNNFNADILNTHYASVSLDPIYTPPLKKLTCTVPTYWPSEYATFMALDNLKMSAAGPDGLPSWFIKLAAPGLALPVSHLFNLSIMQSHVPLQWKCANITPIPKVPLPKSCSDYRPISLTPILCRVIEKLIIKTLIYPSISMPNSTISDSLADQFAFRPTGSTSAALIYLLHTVSDLLEIHPYVHVISCDFSKAFDSVRHSSLMTKIAELPIPDFVYNWIGDFLGPRSHCTKFGSTISSLATINAGVVQGSALGPAAFIICASDLHAITPGNKTCKYADDLYLIVPASNTLSIQNELESINVWATNNNLCLNPKKSSEIIFKHMRSHFPDPPLTDGLARVKSLKILGVVMQSNMLMTEHIHNLVSKSAQNLYALKLLKSNGLSQQLLTNVCNSTLLSRLSYASVAWWGYTSSDDRVRLQAILNKAHRWGFYVKPSIPNFLSVCEKSDSVLFRKVCSTHSHVLHQFLPPPRLHSHNLRARSHNLTLPVNSSHMSRNFLHRLLFRDAY